MNLVKTSTCLLSFLFPLWGVGKAHDVLIKCNVLSSNAEFKTVDLGKKEVNFTRFYQQNDKVNLLATVSRDVAIELMKQCGNELKTEELAVISIDIENYDRIGKLTKINYSGSDLDHDYEYFFAEGNKKKLQDEKVSMVRPLANFLTEKKYFNQKLYAYDEFYTKTAVPRVMGVIRNGGLDLPSDPEKTTEVIHQIVANNVNNPHLKFLDDPNVKIKTLSHLESFAQVDQDTIFSQQLINFIKKFGGNKKAEFKDLGDFYQLDDNKYFYLNHSRHDSLDSLQKSLNHLKEKGVLYQSIQELITQEKHQGAVNIYLFSVVARIIYPIKITFDVKQKRITHVSYLKSSTWTSDSKHNSTLLSIDILSAYHQFLDFKTLDTFSFLTDNVDPEANRISILKDLYHELENKSRNDLVDVSVEKKVGVIDNFLGTFEDDEEDGSDNAVVFDNKFEVIDNFFLDDDCSTNNLANGNDSKATATYNNFELLERGKEKSGLGIQNFLTDLIIDNQDKVFDPKRVDFSLIEINPSLFLSKLFKSVVHSKPTETVSGDNIKIAEAFHRGTILLYHLSYDQANSIVQLLNSKQPGVYKRISSHTNMFYGFDLNAQDYVITPHETLRHALFSCPSKMPMSGNNVKITMDNPKGIDSNLICSLGEKDQMSQYYVHIKPESYGTRGYYDVLAHGLSYVLSRGADYKSSPNYYGEGNKSEINLGSFLIDGKKLEISDPTKEVEQYNPSYYIGWESFEKELLGVKKKIIIDDKTLSIVEKHAVKNGIASIIDYDCGNYKEKNRNKGYAQDLYLNSDEKLLWDTRYGVDSQQEFERMDSLQQCHLHNLRSLLWNSFSTIKRYTFGLNVDDDRRMELLEIVNSSRKDQRFKETILDLYFLKYKEKNQTITEIDELKSVFLRHTW